MSPLPLSADPPEGTVPLGDAHGYVEATAAGFALGECGRLLLIEQVRGMLADGPDGVFKLVPTIAPGTKHILYTTFLTAAFCRNVTLAAQNIAAGLHPEISAVGLDNRSVAEPGPGDESGSGEASR